MIEWFGLVKNADNKLPKLVVRSRFAIAILSLAVLCTSAMAQNNTAEDWYKKGLELNRNGSLEDAVRAFDRAIEISPNDITLWAAKVSSLNGLGKYNESLETLDKAFQIDPENPKAWELKGSTLFQMERYNESLVAYDNAIENIENYKGGLPVNRSEMLSGIWLSKGVTLRMVGRPEEDSLSAFDKAIQIDSQNSDAWIWMGDVLKALGRYNDSIQAYDRAFEATPPIPAAQASLWVHKADVLMEIGRYEDARDVYGKVIGLNSIGDISNSWLARGWRGIGKALVKLGDYNESLQAFDKAIELDTQLAHFAWGEKGDALRDMGKYDDALKAYDKALEMYPEFAQSQIAQAWKGKGDVFIKLNKRDEALKAYGEAIKAYDGAIKSKDKAIEPYPLDAEFWYGRGIALKVLGRSSEADTAFAKAKELGYTDRP